MEDWEKFLKRENKDGAPEKSPEPVKPPEKKDPVPAQPGESEQKRVEHADAVRKKLDVAYGGEDESNADQRRTTEQATEDRMAIISALRKVIDVLQVLFSSLARNKFPRAGFDSSELAAVITRDTLDGKALVDALLNIPRSLNRITVPEDLQERLQIRPENFKAVIRILEELKDDLLFLRNAFSKAQSQNLQGLSAEVNRTRTILERKIDDLSHFQRLRQKVDRGY